MKQILLFWLVSSFSITTLAQYADTSAHILPINYLKKSKNQKTAGWIFLSGGAIMTIIATAVFWDDVENDLGNIFNPNPAPDKNNETLGNILGYGGLAAMAGSIPMFILAGKNRKKAAASVSFKMENATNIFQCTVANTRYPAVAIQIRL